MLKTNEEAKQKCIKELEKLIQNIKDDKTSYNYSFNWEVLRMQTGFGYTETDVRFFVERTEYKQGNTNVSISFNHCS